MGPFRDGVKYENQGFGSEQAGPSERCSKVQTFTWRKRLACSEPRLLPDFGWTLVNINWSVVLTKHIVITGSATQVPISFHPV